MGSPTSHGRAATRATASGARPHVGRPVFADGTLEALKWLGVVLMTLDHANRFVFHDRVPVVFEAARVVMPIFGFVLAYNLARPGAMRSGVYGRTMRRLFIFGLLASPMFVLLVGWWPLNILFMLLLATAVIYLVERGSRAHAAAAATLFVAGGAIVEFWWFGVLSCLAAWAYCRRPDATRLLCWIGAVASLAIVNGNLWSLAAFPLLLGASRLSLPLPRFARFFYWFYPSHLAAILLWQRHLV